MIPQNAVVKRAKAETLRALTARVSRRSLIALPSIFCR